MSLRISWKVIEGSPDQINFTIIIAVLVPSFLCCCIIMCLYSYYFHRRSMRTSPDKRYMEMNRFEDISETIIQIRFPSKYQLNPNEEICPICFDW